MVDSATDMLAGGTTTTAGTTSPTNGSDLAATTTGVDVKAGTVQGGNGTATDTTTQVGFDWKSQNLADEDLGYLQTKAYKTPADVLKALRNAEKLVGLDKLPMPKDDTDADGWNRVYSRLGRPDSPDKYDLGQLPDTADKEYIGAMLKAMHAAGASQKVVTAAFKQQLQFEQARNETSTKARELASQEDFAKLRTEWGNGYDTQVEHARRAIREQSVDKAVLQKIEGAIGPAQMMKLFAGYGAKFAEDKGVVGQGEGDFGRMTPQAAKYKISQLMADREFVRKYTDGTPAERELAMKEMKALQEAANPV